MKSKEKVECWHCGKAMAVKSDNNNLWTRVCRSCVKVIGGRK